MTQFAPQSLEFLDVAERNGRFVAVTEELVVVTDGEIILSVESISEDVSLAAIAAGDTGFVAVGCIHEEETGVILASSGGKYWHEVFRGPGCLNGAEWGNDQWLALGDRTVVVGGRNLEQWIQVPVGRLERDSLAAAVWIGDQWIAVGQGGIASEAPYGWVVSSPDGYAWSTVDRPQDRWFLDVAWNGDRLVAVGWDFIWTSELGLDWNAGIWFPGTGVIWDGQRFVAVGSFMADGGVISLLATSSDGLDWESDYTWVWQAQNLAYDGVRYGVVGRRTLEFSEDLSSRFWASPRDSMPVEKVEVLLETEDELIAVGTHEYGGNHDMPNSYLGVSADGVEWQWESVGCWVEDAAAHGGVVVFSCCCEQSLRVNDGGNWSLSNEFEGFPKLLAAGDPGFVFAIDDDVGYPPEDRRLFFSPDGFQWSSIGDVPFEHIDTLDWVNGNFVVCAGDGLGLSADGTNWEFFEIPGFGYTRSLSGDGRRLVRSVGSAGIKFSDDGGRTWSVATVPEGPRFNDLSWADGHFVAVGFSGTVAFSRDGEIWHRESVPWPLYLSQVVFRDGRYIVGGNSALLLGDPGPAPRHSGGRRGH